MHLRRAASLHAFSQQSKEQVEWQTTFQTLNIALLCFWTETGSHEPVNWKYYIWII